MSPKLLELEITEGLLIHNIDTRLADAIIAMGKSIGVTVVAQGVETREQAEFLRVHACDEVTGILLRTASAGGGVHQAVVGPGH
jgi:EAL domain-containing protein (putative c-di-GMP-specific phosphodiesterase class I)